MAGKTCWLILMTLMLSVMFIGTVIASAQTAPAPTQLRRCENNYDQEEIDAMQADGEDGYEPDDCPMLAHTLTGPMRLNFCQLGDEDWVKFKAKPNMLYQIQAQPDWNFPTEPRLELLDDGQVIAQNDHYFLNFAEVWYWNGDSPRVLYLRIYELAGRAECGNSAYTLWLHEFAGIP